MSAIKHLLLNGLSILTILLIMDVNATELVPLSDIITSEHRSESNLQRNEYRHPVKTLEFLGIKADMSVIEVWPGKGWYTEILAPYLKQGGGKLIAAGFPLNAGPQWRQTMQAEYQQWMGNYPDIYGDVELVELGPPSYWQLGAKNSVDAVLTFRNVHNWLKGGYEANMFAAFYNVLKPGGILGITDHRANAEMGLSAMKLSGYLSQSLVISLATQAGFVLEQASEINANSLDTKDYSKGVWTLPPTLRLGDENKKLYLAIGESDRMTLRFRKPN